MEATFVILVLVLPTALAKDDPATDLHNYAIDSYLAYVDKNIEKEPAILGGLRRAFGIAWVGSRPAEWLCLIDVVDPLRERDYIPDFAHGFKADGKSKPNLTIYVQMSEADSEDTERLRLNEMASAFKTEGAHTWIRSVTPGLDQTRITLIVNRSVKRASGEAGTLHAVETLVLQNDAGRFVWVREKTCSQFRKD